MEPCDRNGLKDFTLFGLRIDPTNPATLYAFGGVVTFGSDRVSDGVAVSTDGGENFILMNTGFSSIPFFVDFKIDPQNPNKLYAVTYGNGVYVYEK